MSSRAPGVQVVACGGARVLQSEPAGCAKPCAVTQIAGVLSVRAPGAQVVECGGARVLQFEPRSGRQDSLTAQVPTCSMGSCNKSLLVEHVTLLHHPDALHQCFSRQWLPALLSLSHRLSPEAQPLSVLHEPPGGSAAEQL